MKRILAAAAIVGLLGFGALAPRAQAISTFATDESDGGSVSLAKGQTKDGAYYAAAQTVTVDGTVNGDVYCAGQHIYINGTVNGDVLCAGQMVTIRGTVSGDVRTAGQMIEIAGTVSGMVRIFAEFAKDSAAQQEALASDISRILYTTVGGIVLSVMGVILLLVALIGAKYRASWFKTAMWILAVLWLFSIPIGTILGIIVLVYLSKHSNEFTEPSPAPYGSPAAGSPSGEA